MKNLFVALLLSLLALTTLAAEVRFNGTKPQAIIDVRTPAEFAAGHIDGAINIPFDQIAHGIRSVKGLKKNSAILLYCRSGRRSGAAKATLEQLGFQRILDGGGMETLAYHLKTCSAKTC